MNGFTPKEVAYMHFALRALADDLLGIAKRLEVSAKEGPKPKREGNGDTK